MPASLCLHYMEKPYSQLLHYHIVRALGDYGVDMSAMAFRRTTSEHKQIRDLGVQD